MKNFLSRLFTKQFPGATARIETPIVHNIRTGRAAREEGYMGNVVVFRCIDSIIKAMKGIEVQIKQGDEIITDHPALDILRIPNPSQKWAGLLEEAFVNKLTLGEMFLVTADNADAPQEIWNLDPLTMQVKPGRGIPLFYEQKVNGKTVNWPVDQITGESQVFFWKDHNPKDMWRGMGPLHAASLAADTNNAGLKWNFSLLKKGARMSGLIKFKGVPDEQAIIRLQKWFKQTMQGENNAGELAVLTGEADFVETGKSPKDMDYSKTVDATTAFIAMGFGVPLPLVLTTASTFNNYREAKEQFYTDTVMPTFGEFLLELGCWLLPRFGLEGAEYIFDKDSIPALELLRERRSKRNIEQVKAGVISPDEARKEMGREERGGIADMLFMPANMFPIEETTNTDDDEKIKRLLKNQGYNDDAIENAMEDV